MASVPSMPAAQVLAGLLLFLTAGLVYAAWFRRQRQAWGFIWLLWLTLGALSGGAHAGIDGERVARVASVAWMLLPWNLLLLAVLPGVALRSWGTAAVVSLLALQLLAPALWPAERPQPLPDVNQQIVGLAPEALRGWITPLEPVLVVVASLVFFGRWQKTDQSEELALFAVAIALLLAVLLPGWAAWFVALGGLVLFASVVVEAHRMAFKDALTGLPNRRALDSALRGLPARYAIAMVDVDHFKSVNDRFGHDFGDQVLRRVAARLRGIPGCRAYRYGGEEFCLLFRGQRTLTARDTCDRAREEVAEPPMAIRGGDRPRRRPVRRRRARDNVAGVPVTVSIGLGFPRGGDTPEQTIEAADRALYRAKRGGRNRVMVAGKPRRG